MYKDLGWKCGPIIVILFQLFLFAGCAGVKFYDGEDLKTAKETGLKFYYPKPYLLVARTGAKDKPVEVSIVWFPDLARPQIAKFKAGWGSHEFSVALSNGILTNYGQKGDTKIPETLTAVGSLLGTASAFRDAERAKSLRNKVLGLPAVAAYLDRIAESLSETAKKYHSWLIDSQPDDLRQAELKLRKVAVAFKTNPNFTEDDLKELKSAKGLIEDAKFDEPPASGTMKEFNSLMDTIAEDLDAILEELQPPQEEAAFELYEIREEKGKIVLVPVSIEEGK